MSDSVEYRCVVSVRSNLPFTDTLDLQDQDSPSTQDHHKHSAQNVDFGDNLIGSHHASEIRHIHEERQDEQRNLQQAWNATGENQGAFANGVNGHHAGDDGKSAAADSESDAASDDDLMDRTSSSPSIDDGEYFTRKAQKPAYVPSLQRSVARWDLSQPNPEPLARSDDDTASEDGSTASSDDWPGPQTPVTNFFARFYGLNSPGNTPGDKETNDLDNEPAGYTDDHFPPIPEIPERFGNAAPRSRTMAPHHEDHKDPSWNLPLQTVPEDPSTVGTSTSDLDSNTSARSTTAASFDTSSETPWGSESGDDHLSNLTVQALRIDFDGCWLLRDTDCRFIRVNNPDRRLQSTEDIDFDFVYALHTFVATVEGQANAIKGDTMVLLDDSNSYWWLVRVVKDSSIGYLPAEHIETPTERLARLNKHRNVDVRFLSSFFTTASQ